MIRAQKVYNLLVQGVQKTEKYIKHRQFHHCDIRGGKI